MIIIDGQAIDLQKNKKKFIGLYHNKQSSFLGNDEIRQRIFSLKSKATKSLKKNDFLYLPVNLASAISDTFSDYVSGGGIVAEFETTSKQEDFDEIFETLKIQKKINVATTKQSYVGYSVLRVRTTNKEITEETLKLDIIPTQNYFPELNGLSIGDEFLDLPAHYIISEVKEKINATTIEKFAYVDSYIKTDTGRTYTKEKYKTDGNKNKSMYSINDLGFRMDTLVEVMIEPTEIKYLPLFIVNNTTDDEDESVANSVFGISDLKNVMELLQEYNDRYTQISVEFIKHLESAISIPNQLYKNIQQAKRLRKQQADKNGEISEDYSLDNLGKVYTHGAGEQPAHYLTKNIETDKGIARLKKIVIDVSSIVGIPEMYLGVKSEVEITATEVLKNNDKFYKKIGKKQQELKPELKRYFDIWFGYYEIQTTK